MDFYLQGLTLGLAYVAPIGMQNLFVINSALTQSRLRALITALIVIFFDVTLAMACFFGIGLVMQKYAAVQMAVTWLNAQAVIDGTMLLGAFKATMSHAQSLHFLFGVLSASCLWFTGLALVVSLAGNLITPRVLSAVNKICGAVIIIYGLKLLCHFVEMV